MHILTKRGNLDNIITYEHICDTTEDMAFIEQKYITLGSTCVVLQGEGGGMEVYMADSNKEWHDIMVTGGNEATTAGLELHVCTAAEVQNGKPNIETPLESTLYLVPSGSESGNLYDEYVYVNEQWELFGGARINMNGYATESWVQQQGYLTRVPHATESDYGTIKLGAGLAQIVDAQGHDEGIGVLLAPNSLIKQGTETDWAVPVSGAGAAAFYGLAKAAGDTTQAQSSNAVGTYTDAAKTAIQEMLDVPSNDAIPTKVSDLTNDSGFITSFTETDPTVPAWAKAATKPAYTAAEVGAPSVQEMNAAITTAIGDIHSFDVEVVSALPTSNIATHTIYFVPKSGDTNDIYDEYLYINNKWEMIGNTQVDLSGYALTSAIPTNVSQLSNDSGYLTSFTETDPTVPAWAKASTKPTYTAAEVGAATQADITNAINSLIVVSDTAPSDSSAKIWIDNNNENSVQVPTVEEMNTALAAKEDKTQIVNVSDTDPVITAAANTQYICGEVATLSFTPAASGVSDIIFESGTTATVLTVPSTVKFPEWFDPSDLEANKVYEISIMNGVYGAVMAW